MYVSLLFIICSISIENVLTNECSCVPLNACGDSSTSIHLGGQLDIRLPNSECSNYFEVCCENVLTEVQTSTQIQRPSCGIQNTPGFGARIISNGDNAQFGEHPWTVIILLKDLKKERNLYKCGGSLIHPQVVVTAAHCVFGENHEHMTVRAGEWNTRSQEEPLPHQDMTVYEVIVHPNFSQDSLQNDIALLFLVQAFVMYDNLGIVCLPPIDIILEQDNCIASGWGKDAFKKGKHSSILKKVALPIVPKDECESSLRKTRLGDFFVLHQSFICAGGEKNKDTCKGDGGSPLVCRVPMLKNRFFQMGIVSWGIGCGEETPGVYTNVRLYVDWIDGELFRRNLDANIYKFN